MGAAPSPSRRHTTMQPRCPALSALLLLAIFTVHASSMPARALLGRHESKQTECKANRDESSCAAQAGCQWKDGKCFGSGPGGDCFAMTDQGQAACDADSKCRWSSEKNECHKKGRAPVADKPKEEERPRACEARSCQNGGVCSVNPRGNPPILCNCTTTGFCGPRCGQEESACQQRQERQREMAQSTDRAGRAGANLEKEKEKCTDETKKMLCPKAAGPNARTCVEALADCFMIDGVYNATLADRAKKDRDGKCGAGEKYCAQEDVCVGRGASCAPQTKCPSDKSYRCPSWKCKADADQCNDGARPEACPEGEMRCPDGLCYPGSGGIKECAKKGVQWEGCPPGKMECSNGRPGTCAQDLAACNAKVGCVAPLKACGFERNATTGKPIFSDDGKPKAKCLDACGVGSARPPEFKKKEFDPSQGGKLEVKTKDGKPAMALKIGRGGFKTKSGRAVNFTVDSVPDSLVQEGAFGEYFESGALLSSLVKVDPGEAVEVEGMMELDIPILDDATSDPDICQKVLDQSVMLSISDITNVSDTVDPAVTCVKGAIGNCSCAINVTHFSTYGVVDKVVAYEERVIVTSASPPSAASSPAGTNGNSTNSSLSGAAPCLPAKRHYLLFAATSLLATCATIA